MTTRKSIRQFSCPDDLWNELEQTARELETSVDGLICAALRKYLRPQRPQPVAFPGPCLSIAPVPDDEIELKTLVISSYGVDYVARGNFVVGSDPSCDLVLPGPDLNPRHVLFELMNGRHYVVDLGGQAGTFWNGQRLDRKLIADGDEISVAGHRLLCRLR